MFADVERVGLILLARARLRRLRGWERERDERPCGGGHAFALRGPSASTPRFGRRPEILVTCALRQAVAEQVDELRVPVLVSYGSGSVDGGGRRRAVCAAFELLDSGDAGLAQRLCEQVRVVLLVVVIEFAETSTGHRAEPPKSQFAVRAHAAVSALMAFA